MKNCELCNQAARMYCESDQANLCWDCDAKVHGANFLVARHPRVLLCRGCQSPTPWRAAGARLSPTFSFCDGCSAGRKDFPAAEGGEEEMMEDDEEDYDDEEVSSESEEVEEEEGENQVVPWTQTPPPAASSSSGEDADLDSQDDFSCDKDRRRSPLRQANPSSAGSRFCHSTFDLASSASRSPSI